MRTACAVTAALLLIACGAKRHPDQASLTPEESLKRIQLSEDFHVELFATEPQVADPVEMAFDENGRAYVAEMLDYPDDPPPGKPARSRIRILEDTNGDGRIDKSTLFADQVLEVSGLMPWKGGLLVTSAPDILYMKDTNGDGKADIREVLYTGFPKVNPEGRITNLRLGVDNWIYAANNGGDGKITSPKHPQRPALLVRGTDFRFHPIRDIAERSSGPAQFGLTIDDWGNRFMSQNTIHLRHAVVPMQYLGRAPTLEVGAVSHDVYSGAKQRPAPMFPLTKPQQWRSQRTEVRQQRYNETNPGRVEHLAGYITGASGSTLYMGDVYPKEYWGNVFTGDVSANLVRRDILTPDGVTFSARAAKDGVEFLASSDVWFRPCHFANAPDGNLYLLDMYREFIETPESIPEELKKNLDFWSGDTMGRIYRIVSNKPLRQRSLKVNLGAASTAELVRELENTNGWHRQTAHRLLLERQDKSAAPLLEQVVQTSQSPVARVHALWLLEGISALKPEHVLAAVKDAHPGIREHALRLAEPFLASSSPLRDAVLALHKDPEVRVQFQAAFTLGDVKDPRAVDALADVAAAHGNDRWFRIAVLSSTADAPARFLQTLARRGRDWHPDLLSQLASLIGARRQPAEVAAVLTSLSSFNKPESALSGLARGLKLAQVHGLTVPGAERIFSMLVRGPEPMQKAAFEAARHLRLPGLVHTAAADVVDTKLPSAQRAAAAALLSGADYSTAAPLLGKVLDSTPPPEVQIAAVESLATFAEPAAAATLLDHWKSYGPQARGKVVAALLDRREWIPIAMNAIEKEKLEPSAIEVAARVRLLENPDKSIAERARKLFHTSAGDRAQVVEGHRDVLRLTGVAQNGKAVFEENCGKCHLPRKQGGRVGPDLSGVNNKTKDELLTSILNPSYAIESRYVNYMITTKDGHMYDGVISNETPGSITLRGGVSDEDTTILRESIAEIRASSISLMPDELEKSMTKQQLADVIAYLRAGL